MAVTITRGEAKASQIGKEQETDEAKDAAIILGEAQQVEIEGRRQYFRLQDRWSDSIIEWITALLLFNCVLIVLVGGNVLKYDRTPWLITAFVTEIFLQVIGLGYIAARFLFPGAAGQAGSEGRRAKRSKRKSKKDSNQSAES